MWNTTRIPLAVFFLASILSAAGAERGGPAVSASAPASAPAKWAVYRDKEFTLIVPSGWRDQKMPGIVLYLQGDGIGVPLVDETGDPIQIGLTIERYVNQKGTALEGARQNAAAAKRNPRLEPVKDPSVEEIKLSDGTPAAYLSVEFIKEGSRRSLQQKVFAKDANSTGWVAIGWIVCGKDSELLEKVPQLPRLLRAHIESLCFDPQKVSEDAVRKAYQPTTAPASAPASGPSGRRREN